MNPIDDERGWTTVGTLDASTERTGYRHVRARSHGAMARMIADYERQMRRRMLLALILEAGVFLFLLVGVVGCLYLLGMATQP